MSQSTRRIIAACCLLVAVGLLAAVVGYIPSFFRGDDAENRYAQKNRLAEELRDQEATMTTVKEKLGPPDNIVNTESCIIWLYAGPSMRDEEPNQWITIRFDIATKRIIGVGNVL